MPTKTASPKQVTFTTTLELMGKTAMGIVVPPEVVEKLGKGKKPPVKVTINKYTYRSTIAVMDGRYLLPVAADNRAASGVAAGDSIVVALELDAEPRTVEVPSDLAQALEANPAAKAAFDKLAYSHRKEHVRALEDAKAPETRLRRLAKTMELLTKT